MTRPGHVITRFAPSPSGHLHIGGARTALFCWAFARRHDGTFILRVEDTDRARSSEASERAILEDLAWLGIDWDEGPELAAGGRTIGGDPRGVGPFRQSERRAIYDDHVERLIEGGLAYPAFDTTEELAARRAEAEARKETFRYRPAPGFDRDDAVRRMRAGEPCVVRLRAPESEAIVVADEVLGEVRFAPGELEDFVIRKADGFPTYHLAVVVDDALMGVTHVLRGQEHLNNAPKHVALQRALGFPEPIYAHMPLIFNDRGAKMSKRERDVVAKKAVADAGIEAPPGGAVDAAEFGAWLGDKRRALEPDRLDALAEAMGLRLPEVSVHDFRRAGYLPEVIVNFIALLGWTPSKLEDGSDREKFDGAFLAGDFDPARIGKSNARFDRAKLAAFNKDALGAMGDDEFERRYRDWADANDPGLIGRVGGDRFGAFARMVRPRASTFGDAADAAAFALTGAEAIEYDPKGVKKHLRSGEPAGLTVLAELRAVVGGVEPFEPAPIEAAVKAFCEARGLGMGKAAQPLRVAMTGAPVSPALGDTLAILGRDEALRRIDRCLAAHAEGASA